MKIYNSDLRRISERILQISDIQMFIFYINILLIEELKFQSLLYMYCIYKTTLFQHVITAPILYYKYVDLLISAVANAIRTSLGPRGMDKMVNYIAYASQCTVYMCYIILLHISR